MPRSPAFFYFCYMDNNLTKKIGSFLNNEKPTDKEIIEAAEMLLSLDPGRERGIYNSALRRPQGMLPWIRTDLKKFYAIRQRGMDNKDAERFNKETVKLVDETLGAVPEGTVNEFNENNIKQEQILGKRADHDQLPDDIKKLWDDNGKNWAQLRKLRLQLSELVARKDYQSCDGNELCYQLRKLDDSIRANYKKYDEWNPEENEELTPEEQAQELNKKINQARVTMSRTLKKETLSDDDVDSLQEAVNLLFSAKASIKPATIDKLKAAGVIIPEDKSDDTEGDK